MTYVKYMAGKMLPYKPSRPEVVEQAFGILMIMIGIHGNANRGRQMKPKTI